MTDATPIVRARGLRKSFNGKSVLKGLDISIPPGRIYGLLGQNGAGKTTALNALLGLTSCEGEVEVLGLDPFRRRAQLMRDVAFVSDVASLPRYLRVRELFALVSDIHPGFDAAKAWAFLQGTDLAPELKIKTLSKGMLAQLHLSLVMAIDARLLVLDEPTLGLDIIYRKRFYSQLLDDYMTEARTLVIATHQIDEIEFMLTDLLVIHQGRILLDSPMEEIPARFAQLVVTPETEEAARALGPIYAETRFGQTAMVFRDAAQSALAPLGTLSVPNLSDLFVALTQGPGANEGAPS